LVKKGSKSYSILYNKCPKCHRGKFWHKNNPYLNILKDNKLTNDHCNRCKFKYEIEPGFWFGAMNVSYGIAVVFLIIFGVCLVSLFKRYRNTNNGFSFVYIGSYFSSLKSLLFKTNLDKYFC